MTTDADDAIRRELQTMIGAHLFGPGPHFLRNRKTILARSRRLTELGLQTEDGSGFSRNTPLGDRFHTRLMMVFLGIFDPLETPMVLRDHGLMTEDEVDAVYDSTKSFEHETLPPISAAGLQAILRRAREGPVTTRKHGTAARTH